RLCALSCLVVAIATSSVRSQAAAQGAHATPAASVTEVVIDQFAFKPRLLTIKAGTTVTWINRDDVPHTAPANAQPRAFASGTLATDDRFSFTFTKPGAFDYFCALHPHMIGQVIVK